VARGRAGTLVFSAAQGGSQLCATLDPELGVHACEVALDRLQGHEQLTGDFAVGAALGGKPGNAQFAGGQRFDASAPRAPRAGACRLQLVAHPGRERPGAAPDGQIQPPGERLAGRGAFTGSPQGRPEFRQRVGPLKQRRRAAEHGYRLLKQFQPFRTAARQPGGPQGDPQRTRRAEHPHVSQLGFGKLARTGTLAQPQERSAAPERACT
jgi:hypothetical protein